MSLAARATLPAAVAAPLENESTCGAVHVATTVGAAGETAVVSV